MGFQSGPAFFVRTIENYVLLSIRTIEKRLYCFWQTFSLARNIQTTYFFFQLLLNRQQRFQPGNSDCIAIEKSGFFEKKISKWPVTQTFFSESLFSSTSSCEGVTKVGLFMFKIPDFSLVPCLCTQAGVDFVSAWKDLDPRTLISGDRRHFASLYAALRIAPEPP